MSSEKKNHAVFLDRDGTLTELVLNPKSNQYEAPHHLRDLQFIYSSLASLLKLQNLGFKLFIVSNQPDYALGKTSKQEIDAIADQIMKDLKNRNIEIKKAFYCYHHPKAVLEEFAKECECRKPKPGFLMTAAREYNIDLKRSWMIGDQDSDVECGIAAGCQTALLQNPHSSVKRGLAKPTLLCRDLEDAVKAIMRETK